MDTQSGLLCCNQWPTITGHLPGQRTGPTKHNRVPFLTGRGPRGLLHQAAALQTGQQPRSPALSWPKVNSYTWLLAAINSKLRGTCSWWWWMRGSEKMRWTPEICPEQTHCLQPVLTSWQIRKAAAGTHYRFSAWYPILALTVLYSLPLILWTSSPLTLQVYGTLIPSPQVRKKKANIVTRKFILYSSSSLGIFTR